MPYSSASIATPKQANLADRTATGADLETSAASFIAAVELAGGDQLDAHDIARRVSTLRAVQSIVEAALVTVGLQADRLAAADAGAPARDALLGSGRVRGSTARQEAKRSALAARSTELATWMGSGRLGPDHLDALVRRVGPLTDEQFDRLDLAPVLTAGCELPADTFDVALRRATEDAVGDKTADDDPDETPTPAQAAHSASEVTHWFDHQAGMGRIFASLDPERYEAVANSIDQHTATLANRVADKPVSKDANLAAEAFVELICGSGRRQAHLPHVTVVVDSVTLTNGPHAQTVAETADGHGLSSDAIRRLCCDAVMRTVSLDPNGSPIAVGRRHRTATNAQWAALRAIYRSCAWHGCDRPLSHCQAHHIKEWKEGGRTDLPNLVPLCSHHHHLVHEGRWRIELGPDRSLQIRRPDGNLYCTTGVPTRTPPPLEPD